MSLSFYPWVPNRSRVPLHSRFNRTVVSGPVTFPRLKVCAAGANSSPASRSNERPSVWDGTSVFSIEGDFIVDQIRTVTVQAQLIRTPCPRGLQGFLRSSDTSVDAICAEARD